MDEWVKCDVLIIARGRSEMEWNASDMTQSCC
jgi:hypothetical protein